MDMVLTTFICDLRWIRESLCRITGGSRVWERHSWRLSLFAKSKSSLLVWTIVALDIYYAGLAMQIIVRWRDRFRLRRIPNMNIVHIILYPRSEEAPWSIERTECQSKPPNLLVLASTWGIISEVFFWSGSKSLAKIVRASRNVFFQPVCVEAWGCLLFEQPHFPTSSLSTLSEACTIQGLTAGTVLPVRKPLACLSSGGNVATLSLKSWAAFCLWRFQSQPSSFGHSAEQ